MSNIIERVTELNKKLANFEEKINDYERRFKELNIERENMLDSDTIDEYNTRVVNHNKALTELRQEEEDLINEGKMLDNEVKQLGGDN